MRTCSRNNGPDTTPRTNFHNPSLHHISTIHPYRRVRRILLLFVLNSFRIRSPPFVCDEPSCSPPRGILKELNNKQILDTPDSLAPRCVTFMAVKVGILRASYMTSKPRSWTDGPSLHRRRVKGVVLPALLASEALIQEHEHLGNVELDVLQIQVFLVVLLHLQQIVQLQVQLEQAAVAALVV